VEVQLNKSRETTRSMAWVAALGAALALGLMGWYALANSASTHSTAVVTPPAVSSESPRNGGPGGQIGDTAQPPQTTRSGGPGGQIGDAQ
jgi:hypothetical protein